MSGLFCIGSMFCDLVPVAHSSLAIIFLGMVEVIALHKLRCDCLCYVFIINGAVTCSIVCDFGISR